MKSTALRDELITLIDSSLSIATLSEKNRAQLKKNLLSLPPEEMEQAAETLRQEQREQYQSMKGLVQKIEEASKNLKKTFLKDREKEELKDSDANAQQLLKELDNQ